MNVDRVSIVVASCESLNDQSRVAEVQKVKKWILVVVGIALSVGMFYSARSSALQNADAAQISIGSGATLPGAGGCKVCSINWGERSSSCENWPYSGGEYCVALPGIECVTWGTCTAGGGSYNPRIIQ